MVPTPMPAKDFKPSWLTTEFLGTALLLITLARFMFQVGPSILAIIAFTAITCAYSISRALHKKNRGSLLHDGERTTEFYTSFGSCFVFVCLMYQHRIASDLGLLCIALIWSAYTLSRGHTKSLYPQAKVNLFS